MKPLPAAPAQGHHVGIRLPLPSRSSKACGPPSAQMVPPPTRQMAGMLHFHAGLAIQEARRWSKRGDLLFIYLYQKRHARAPPPSPWLTRQSAGMLEPAASSTRSPGTSRAASRFCHVPSRLQVATGFKEALRAATASAAFTVSYLGAFHEGEQTRTFKGKRTKNNQSKPGGLGKTKQKTSGDHPSAGTVLWRFGSGVGAGWYSKGVGRGLVARRRGGRVNGCNLRAARCEHLRPALMQPPTGAALQGQGVARCETRRCGQRPGGACSMQHATAANSQWAWRPRPCMQLWR